MPCCDALARGRIGHSSEVLGDCGTITVFWKGIITRTTI
jgi:hypothetical protein